MNDGTRLFQFTPLREGRHAVRCAPPRKRVAFQFTPLREGRRLHSQGEERFRSISIHAPPRGATPFFVAVFGLSHFNSRPSARGDFAEQPLWNDSDNFNSRPSARGDSEKQEGLKAFTIFQFTPLREGRHFQHEANRSRIYFNSRPSARGDSRTLPGRIRRHLFQFTPLREGRPCANELDRRRNLYFNSRPSARGDLTAEYNPIENYISIHAPPRGAT